MKQTYHELMDHFSLSTEKRQEIARAMEKERRKQEQLQPTWRAFFQRPKVLALCFAALILIVFGVSQLHTPQPPVTLPNPVQDYQSFAELKKETPFPLNAPTNAGEAEEYMLISGEIAEIHYSDQLTYRAGKTKDDVLGGVEQGLTTEKNGRFTLFKQKEHYKGILFREKEIYYFLYSEEEKSEEEWLVLARSIN